MNCRDCWVRSTFAAPAEFLFCNSMAPRTTTPSTTVRIATTMSSSSKENPRCRLDPGRDKLPIRRRISHPSDATQSSRQIEQPAAKLIRGTVLPRGNCDQPGIGIQVHDVPAYVVHRLAAVDRAICVLHCVSRRNGGIGLRRINAAIKGVARSSRYLCTDACWSNGARCVDVPLTSRAVRKRDGLG